MRPATRSRLRPWLLLAILLLTGIYFFTGPRSTQTSDFYQRTVAVMDDARRKAGGSTSGQAAAAAAAVEAKVRSGAGEEIVLEKVPDHEGGKGEQVSHKIGAAAAAAAAQAGTKSQAPLANDLDDAPVKPKTPPRPVGGKVNDKVYEKEADAAVHRPNSKSPSGKLAADEEHDGVAKVGNTGKQAIDSTVLESPAAREVSMLLDEILKKSPIIIFSKSYCPYSKKAKHILLEEYKIVPAPYVHEIDLMDDVSAETAEPLGPALQAKLFEMTKRRTVPNILVNGVSIGGGDDIAALDQAGKLAEKLAEIGGKRVMEVKRVTKDAVGEAADDTVAAVKAAGAKGADAAGAVAGKAKAAGVAGAEAAEAAAGKAKAAGAAGVEAAGAVAGKAKAAGAEVAGAAGAKAAAAKDAVEEKGKAAAKAAGLRVDKET